jgi:hypothetical protein
MVVDPEGKTTMTKIIDDQPDKSLRESGALV